MNKYAALHKCTDRGLDSNHDQEWNEEGQVGQLGASQTLDVLGPDENLMTDSLESF